MDADAENKGVPPEDIPMCTMLYVGIKNKEGHIFEEYQPEIINKQLAKGLNKLCNDDDLKELLKYMTRYLLN